MARAKKGVPIPRRSASGLDNDSSTATSPSLRLLESPIEVAAATNASQQQQALPYVPIVDGGRHMQRHPNSSSSTSTVTSSNSRRSGVRGQYLNSWRKVVEESVEAVVVSHEVDQYLNAALEPTEDEDCFDILCWWKVNGPKFPVLAAIARDVLAIQTSTVASESCFSTGGRVIDPFRSSLTPKTVEGLICMQNWLLGDDIAIVEDEQPTIENMEFYERVETDYESTASSRNVCPVPLPKTNGMGKATVIDV